MHKIHSVAFKLSLLASLLVLGVILFMARMLFKGTEQTLIAEMKVRAEFFARSCREAIFPKIDSFQLHFSLNELLKEKAIVYAAVLDPNGIFLSHSISSRIGEADISAEGKKAASSNEMLLQTCTSDIETVEVAYRPGLLRGPPGLRGKDYRQYFDLSVPVMMGAHRAGTVRLGFTRESIRQALAKQKRQITAIAAAAIFLAVSGTVLLVSWITRPLPLLAKAVAEIGRGNLHARVKWKSRDEIGLLASTFNDMAEKNARLFGLLNEEKEKLQTVFLETHEGAILATAGGDIILINPSASRLMGFSDSSPKTLVEALGNIQCQAHAERILSQKERLVKCEFVREKPRLLVLSGTSNQLTVDNHLVGFLLVFHDATKEKRKEELERGFLSIVSHKLRTPLATTMGFIELMLGKPEGLDDFQKKSLRTILRQSENLRYLVNKLLTFSSVQDPETITMNKESCVVPDMIEEVLKSMSPYFSEKKAEIEWDPIACKSLPPVYAAPWCIKEALKNLIENAVKFNPRETRKVTLRAEVRDNKLRMEVSDNGLGILPEEEPNLFEKFHQIEEDFTGQIEGLGLGLAFVRTVAEAHGGTVGMISKTDEGSTFFFTLPLLNQGT
ncbi:MAG: ATP-binding protein [bacterium]